MSGLHDIPADVVAAAELVGRFFAERNIEVFELGPVRNRWHPIQACERGHGAAPGVSCQCHNDCGDDPRLPKPLRYCDTPPSRL